MESSTGTVSPDECGMARLLALVIFLPDRVELEGWERCWFLVGGVRAATTLLLRVMISEVRVKQQWRRT